MGKNVKVCSCDLVGSTNTTCLWNGWRKPWKPVSE